MELKKHIKGFHDRYAQYRRDHAIIGECLPHSQFIKQLRKSDLFVETETIRFGEDTKHAVILIELRRKRITLHT